MAKRKNNQSPGAMLAARLQHAVRSLRSAPLPGARRLPVVRGVNQNLSFTAPPDNVFSEITSILAQSQQVLRYGSDVVLASGEGDRGRLRVLCEGDHVLPIAPYLMSNFFLCESEPTGDKTPSRFLPNLGLVSHLFNREATLAALPEIKAYSRRPIYDSNFQLLDSGYHQQAGILVHSFAVDPATIEPPDPTRPVLERLPPYLRILLAEFAFRSPADLVNAVAVMVTGVLAYLLVECGKPLVLVDANQPGVGKTFLARAIRIILDGDDCPPITYTSKDDELGNRICGTLRAGAPSVLLIDNARNGNGAPIQSVTLEANVVAPTIAIRVLGHSVIFSRRNDVLWFLTMNGTRVNPDLFSRSIPVRFHYEGNPAERKFNGPDPLEFARQHRVELFAELAGFVAQWTAAGRPDGPSNHRLHQWSKLVGGIMQANGFPEFLSNIADAQQEFNTELDALAALAEVVVGAGDGPLWQHGDGHVARGGTAGDWESQFRKTPALAERLERLDSEKARSTVIGQILGKFLNRTVAISVAGCQGHAELCMELASGNRKRYYFTVSWEQNPPDDLVQLVRNQPRLIRNSETTATRPVVPSNGHSQPVGVASATAVRRSSATPQRHR